MSDCPKLAGEDLVDLDLQTNHTQQKQPQAVRDRSLGTDLCCHALGHLPFPPANPDGATPLTLGPLAHCKKSWVEAWEGIFGSHVLASCRTFRGGTRGKVVWEW